MIIMGTSSATMTADVLEELRNLHRIALVKKVGTETVLPHSPLMFDIVSDWSDSRSCSYETPDEIKDKMESYKTLEQSIPTLGVNLHSNIMSTLHSDMIIHPDELVFNVDVEDNNTRFSEGRGLHEMFPGVYTKMEQLLGG